MAERLTRMYCERLASLAETLAYLGEAVGVDEALALLNDQHLVQYKIDRMAELVRDVLNSEKEQIIIHLILKIEALEASQHTNPHPDPFCDPNHLLYCRKKLEQKTEEAEKLRVEASVLREQLEQQRGLLLQQKAQFQIYQSKQAEFQRKYELLQQQKEEEAGRQLQGQQLAQALREDLRRLGEENKALAGTVGRLEKRNLELAAQQSCESSRQKKQRVQGIRNGMRKLNLDLNEMREMIRIVTHFISASLKQSLASLRHDLAHLPLYVVGNLKEIHEEFKRQCEGIQGRDMLMGRMEKLEGQIDRFLNVKQD